MSWAAAISAGGSVLGGALSGGGGQDKIRPMDAIPDFLKDDYKGLMGGVAHLQQPEYFQGNTVAGINPLTGMGLAGLADYGNQMGGAVGQAQFGAGMGGASAMGGGMDFLNQYAGAGPNQFQFDQGTFNSIYSNPNVDGMIDAVNRDVARGLNWDTMPGLQGAATGAGLQGSTKLGQAGALATGMAADRMADNAAGIRSNAYNQAVSGAMTAGTGNLSSANQFGSNIMQGYGNMAQIGLPQLQSAYGTGMNNLNNVFNAGQYFQDHDQRNIDADMARWNFEQMAPYNHLQSQLALMPQPGGVQQGVPGMTAFEGAMQGLQAAPGVYNMFQDAFGSNQPNIYAGQGSPGADWGAFDWSTFG